MIFIWQRSLFIFWWNYRNRQLLVHHHLTNDTNLLDDAVTNMVNQLNSTNATSIKDWGLQICSLEDNLSKAAEGTGLAFIIFTQAIVELPGKMELNIFFNQQKCFMCLCVMDRINYLGSSVFHDVIGIRTWFTNRNVRRNALYHIRYRHLQTCTQTNFNGCRLSVLLHCRSYFHNW